MTVANSDLAVYIADSVILVGHVSASVRCATATASFWVLTFGEGELRGSTTQ